MAEKEKRIYAYYYKKHPCDGCDAKEVYDGCSCPVLEEYEMSITRQEAINRMAKEMARKYDPLKPNKEEYESVWEHELLPSTQKHFKELAEAALNALLEGK